MPLKWERGQNPYKNNAYRTLELGANATRPVIVATAQQQIMANPERRQAINEAQGCLLNDASKTEELLLIHPFSLPEQQLRPISNRLKEAIRQESLLPDPPRYLKLTNPSVLLSLLPEPSPEDILLPDWEEFEIPSPEDPKECQYDIQFDL